MSRAAGRVITTGLKNDRRVNMAGSVYKLIELTGASKNSVEEAVQTALAKASETVREMRWFEVVETRGTVDNGRVGEWQVTIKVGFRIED
jgi:flavin-binding protein dodecin